MQQNERLNKIDEILKEINAPLIDKINKYKSVFSIVVTIILAVIGAFFTIITVLCNLYNTNIENQFTNIQNQTVENSHEIKELNLEIKELNKKKQYP